MGRLSRRSGIFMQAALALLVLLAAAACERPVGGPSPLATPGLSDRLTVEVREQPTDAAEVQPTEVIAPVATPQATRAPTRSPTWDRDSIPIEYVGTPCHPEIILVPLPWLSDQFVQWSPEGDEVLFTRGAGLYGVREDGTRLREIARGSVMVHPWGGVIGTMIAFGVSPDGKRVAHSTCEFPKGDHEKAIEQLGWREALKRHCYQIATVGIDGEQPRQLTRSAEFANYPAWSPDGGRIAFLAGGDPLSLANEVLLVTKAADGSDEQVIVRSFDSLAMRSPSWSPDGARLAFAGDDGRTGFSIYTVRADGTGLRRLTDTLSGPSWSPDGERIAFAKADGRNLAIFTIAADGTDLMRVTTIPKANADRVPSEPYHGLYPDG